MIDTPPDPEAVRDWRTERRLRQLYRIVGRRIVHDLLAAGHDEQDQLQTAHMGRIRWGPSGAGQALRNLWRHETRPKRLRIAYKHARWRKMRSPAGTRVPLWATAHL